MSAVEQLIDVDALIPDGIEPIEQYRVWNWTGSELISLNGWTRWTAGEPLKATCSAAAGMQYEWVLKRGDGKAPDELRQQERTAEEERQRMAQLSPISTWYTSTGGGVPAAPSVEPPPGYGYVLEAVQHDAPHERCTCGIYAGADTDHGFTGEIWGTVKMWGKIVPGSKGARAEFAYPSELHVPPRLANDPAILAYGVPVIVKKTVQAPAKASARWPTPTVLRVAIAVNFGAAALNLSLVGLHVFH